MNNYRKFPAPGGKYLERNLDCLSEGTNYFETTEFSDSLAERRRAN